MRFLTGLAAAAIGVGPAAAADFRLTGDNTKVEFAGTKPGGKHEGGFKKLAGTATVPGADPAGLAVEVTVETASMVTDDERLTGHLKSPDFFDVKTNTTAKFKSTGVEKLGETGAYKVSGDLTLNGKTKAISFPARIAVEPDTLRLSAEFKISRLDFGVGAKFPKEKIDDEVAMKVKVEAKK